MLTRQRSYGKETGSILHNHKMTINLWKCKVQRCIRDDKKRKERKDIWFEFQKLIYCKCKQMQEKISIRNELGRKKKRYSIKNFALVCFRGVFTKISLFLTNLNLPCCSKINRKAWKKTSEIMLFAKIVNSQMPFTIFTKTSILHFDLVPNRPLFFTLM